LQYIETEIKMIEGDLVNFEDSIAQYMWNTEEYYSTAVYSQFLYKLKFKNVFLFKNPKPMVCIKVVRDGQIGFYAKELGCKKGDKFKVSLITRRIKACFSKNVRSFDSFRAEEQATEEAQKAVNREKNHIDRTHCRARKRLLAQLSYPWSIVHEAKLIQYVQGHRIRGRKQSTTNSSTLLKEAIDRTSKTKMKDGSTLVRHASCGDGHCLFESLSFLYLSHYPLGGEDGEDVLVKLDSILLKCGWRPAPTQTYFPTMETKGNLMDVICFNLPCLLKSVSQTSPPLLQAEVAEVILFFDRYRLRRISNPTEPLKDHPEDYPGETVALFFKKLLFKDDVVLCIHSLSRDNGQPPLLLSNTNTGVAVPPECLSSFTYYERRDLDYLPKRVHLCHSGAHFEPGLETEDIESITEKELLQYLTENNMCLDYVSAAEKAAEETAEKAAKKAAKKAATAEKARVSSLSQDSVFDSRRSSSRLAK
jgi:hypothetical protein